MLLNAIVKPIVKISKIIQIFKIICRYKKKNPFSFYIYIYIYNFKDIRLEFMYWFSCLYSTKNIPRESLLYTIKIKSSTTISFIILLQFCHVTTYK